MQPRFSEDEGILYRPDCTPAGATFDPQHGFLRWAPNPSQVGFHVLRVTGCLSEAPESCAVWEGFIAVQSEPRCRVANCRTEQGCDFLPRPLSESCCGPTPAEPDPSEVALLPCPAGKQLLVGKNLVEGFGILSDCQRFRVINFGQIGATVRLNFAVRCLDVSAPLTLAARMTTAQRELFDASRVVLQFTPGENGFAERRGVAFPVRGPGPFFEFEDAEAELSVRATDIRGETAETTLRLILTFDELSDDSDLPFVTPACESTAGSEMSHQDRSTSGQKTTWRGQG